MERKRIAVLLASIEREYQRNFTAALSAEAEKLDVDVFLFNCQGHSNHIIYANEKGESSVFDLPRLLSFDGIITLRETLADDLSRRTVEDLLAFYAGKPHVSIDVPTNGAVNILFNDYDSVREITTHLIEKHNIRDIVYISGPHRQIVAINRLNACREAMEEHGLTLHAENVYDGEWTQRRGREIAMELVERESGLPEAVICGNDDMALGVIESFHEQGIRVPDDVIVTGFDALREATLRGITTVRRPIDLAARTALKILSDWIDGHTPEKKDLLLPTISVYGSSCRCRQNNETILDRMWMMARERRDLEETLSKVSMFSGVLVSAENERDANLKIDEMVRRWNIGEMYLCVNPAVTREISDEKQDDGDRMLMLYGRRNGESLPIRIFPAKDLLPVMRDPDRTNLCLVFCPLYYLDRNFGYLALEIGEGTGTALYSILMLINGAVMSLYLQNSLRFYGRRMEELTYTDTMTGLLNRRGLDERAPAVLEEARSGRKCFVMLTSDMDHMKQINDRFGHQAGDEAIRRMGRAMESLRGEGMTPVHISGDEFQAYGLAEDENAAERIRRTLEKALKRINEEEPWITQIRTSIGVYAAVPEEGMMLDDYQRTTDRMMYEEKNRRKAQEKLR